MFNLKLTVLTIATLVMAGLPALPAFSQEIDSPETEPVPEQLAPQVADEAHLAAARSLLNQLGPLQSNSDIFYNTLATSAIEGFRVEMGRPLTEEERQQLYRFWYEKLQTVLTAEELEAMLVAVYVRDFTLEELTAINQFYQTPAGLKWQNALPALQQELTAISSSYVLALSSDNEWVTNTLNELLVEIPSLADSQSPDSQSPDS